MAKKRVFLGLILSMCFTVGLSAQETQKESADKSAKVQQDKKSKVKSKLNKRQERLAGSLNKYFAKAELTEEQKEKINEMVSEHWDEMQAVQKELNGMISKEDRKKRSAAQKKATKDGMTKDEARQAGWDALEFSKEDLEKVMGLTDQRNEMLAEMRQAIRATFSDDQKAAMSAKANTVVSVKLPGMTWGGCESSVKKALTEKAGFYNLKTDLASNSATFEIKGDFDYTAKLNEIVEGGNAHVKGWAKNEMTTKAKKGKKKKGKKADGLTSVSVKLPGMTWGGCESSVKKALTAEVGFHNLKTDLSTNSATFEISGGFDFEAKLNEIAENSQQVKGWSKND